MFAWDFKGIFQLQFNSFDSICGVMLITTKNNFDFLKKFWLLKIEVMARILQLKLNRADFVKKNISSAKTCYLSC